MLDSPRFFLVSVPFYAYPTAARKGAVQLVPGQVYTATHVGRQHLTMSHPAQPGAELYLPLAGPWQWQRIILTPAEWPDLPG